MSLDEVKSAAFRYCDKVFLAAVVLFVALKVYSHVSPSQETVGSLGPVSGGQTVEIPTGKPDFRSPAAKPFADIPSPFVVEHDPFWPQQVVRLRPVSLRLPRKGLQEPDKKAKLTDTRTLPAKLVGRLVPWTPPDEFLQLIDPDRERRLASRADLRTPCKVNVAVDRDTRTILTFEAVAAGDWIGYEGNLENKNKVRVVVIVEPADLTPPQVVRRAIVDEVREESLGRVVLRFHLEVPEQATPRAATPAQPPNVQYVEPTYYLIYRKGPLDEKSRVIGRLEGKGLIRAPTSPTDLRRPRRMELQPEGEPPMDMGPPPPTRRRPGTWPRGMPGVAPRRMTPEEAMEGGMPGERIPGMPVPGEMMPPPGDQRRQPTRARATRAGELVFIDSSVESETTYTYWVETVGIRENGKPLESKKCCLKGNTCPGHEITTLKKFSFAYIGNRRMKDGTVSAKIMVFIGSRDDPLEWRTFVVPPGGRIGDLPAEPGALDEETPPAEKPPQPPAAITACLTVMGCDANAAVHSDATQRVIIDRPSPLSILLITISCRKR